MMLLTTTTTSPTPPTTTTTTTTKSVRRICLNSGGHGRWRDGFFLPGRVARFF
jgi:hypothetical protein